MQEAVVPKTQSSGSAPRLTRHAIDLTKFPEHRSLWEEGCPSSLEQTPVGLPPGSASTMGFWVYTPQSGTPLPDNVYPRVFEVWEKGGEAKLPTLPSGRALRWKQTITIKAPNVKDGEATLTITPESAHVIVNPVAWEVLEEPITLAVHQYWRFWEVEQELAQIGKSVRKHLRYAAAAGMRTWWNQHTILVADRAIRNLTQDLPYFEGLLSDPARYCTTEQSVDAYVTLSEKLDLEGWCEHIDTQVETLEGTYETVTDKLFHYKLFVWGFLLEILIIIIIYLNYIRE